MQAYQVISEVKHKEGYPIVEVIKSFTNEDLAKEYLDALLEDNKLFKANKNVSFKIQPVTIHDKL